MRFGCHAGAYLLSPRGHPGFVSLPFRRVPSRRRRLQESRGRNFVSREYIQESARSALRITCRAPLHAYNHTASLGIDSTAG